MISKGAAQSRPMENRWRTVAEGRFDFGFAVDRMRKDLAIALEEGRLDNSSLILNLLRAATKPPLGPG